MNLSQIGEIIGRTEFATSVFNRDAASMVALALEMSQRADNALADVALEMSQRADNLLKLVHIPSVVELLAPSFKQFESVFEQLNSRIAEEREAFRAAGWPLCPSMPQSLIHNVVGKYQTGQTRYASAAVLGYYRRMNCAHLKVAIDEWRSNPLFNTRITIIDDAFWAHKQGKFTLSIPTLIPQIEGIMSDYVVRNHLAARIGKITEVYKAALNDAQYDLFVTRAVAETLRYQLANNFYNSTEFEDELKRAPSVRRISRHTVLHGINPSYAKESVSLRSFLLLDALSVLNDALDLEDTP